jgi:hypothetical protein
VCPGSPPTTASPLEGEEGEQGGRRIPGRLSAHSTPPPPRSLPGIPRPTWRGREGVGSFGKLLPAEEGSSLVSSVAFLIRLGLLGLLFLLPHLSGLGGFSLRAQIRGDHFSQTTKGRQLLPAGREGLTVPRSPRGTESKRRGTKLPHPCLSLSTPRPVRALLSVAFLFVPSRLVS